MTPLSSLAAAGWHRLTRTAAYVLMPKFTAGALVIARDDAPAPPRVLLVRKRSAGSDWGFPAGYVGYGMSIVRTAERELAQETGLRPPIGVEHHLRTYRQPWALHLDHAFLVAARGEPSIQDTVEIAQAAWWPIDALPPLAREARLALDEIPDALTRPIPTLATPTSAATASEHVPEPTSEPTSEPETRRPRHAAGCRHLRAVGRHA